MNAPLRNPNRDLSDCASGLLREQSIENISNRIKSGKGRIGVFELLDIELSGERYKILLEEITTLLCNETVEREAMADQMVSGLIERYISVHGDLVEQEAEEIEAEDQ